MEEGIDANSKSERKKKEELLDEIWGKHAKR